MRITKSKIKTFNNIKNRFKKVGGLNTNLNSENINQNGNIESEVDAEAQNKNSISNSNINGSNEIVECIKNLIKHLQEKVINNDDIDLNDKNVKNMMMEINKLELFLEFNKKFYSILNNLSKNSQGKIGKNKNLIIIDNRFSEYVYSKILAGKLDSKQSWTSKQTKEYKKLIDFRKDNKKSIFSKMMGGENEQKNPTDRLKDYTKALIQKLNNDKNDLSTELPFEELCMKINEKALLSNFNNSLYIDLTKALKAEKHIKSNSKNNQENVGNNSTENNQDNSSEIKGFKLLVNGKLNELLYTKMTHGLLDNEDWPSQRQVNSFIKGINRKGAWTQGMFSFGSKKSNNKPKSSMFSWGKKSEEENSEEQQEENLEEQPEKQQEENLEETPKNGGKKNIRKNKVIKKRKIRKIYNKKITN